MSLLGRALSFSDGPYRDHPALIEEQGHPHVRRALSALATLQESLHDMRVQSPYIDQHSVGDMLRVHLGAIEDTVMHWQRVEEYRIMSEPAVLLVQPGDELGPEFAALLDALADKGRVEVKPD